VQSSLRIAVCFLAAGLIVPVSCRSKTPELPAPNYMSIDQLESRFRHTFYVPDPKLGAELGKSGVLVAVTPEPTRASDYPKTISRFGSRELGAIGYKWKGFSIGPLQGRKSDDWERLEQLAPGQPNAKPLQFPNGEALILPPPEGELAKSSLASAFRLFDDWLVEVTMGPPSKLAGRSDEVMSLLEEFISNLIPYSEQGTPSPSA
jgi:hypothetical protein